MEQEEKEKFLRSLGMAQKQINKEWSILGLFSIDVSDDEVKNADSVQQLKNLLLRKLDKCEASTIKMFQETGHKIIKGELLHPALMENIE